MKSKVLFISHSSKDKSFVYDLTSDLKTLGHLVWLDEWEIKVGESISSKIQQGINSADFIIVVLTRNSVDSGWVEREWMSKYRDEIDTRKTAILPLLKEECDIPRLLKDKKYADFTRDYSNGFLELANSISPLVRSNPKNDEVLLSNELLDKIKEKDIQYITELKEYDSIPTILKLCNPSANINLIDSHSFEAKRIGYSLFNTSDQVIENSLIYYLYLYQGTSLQRTYDYLNEQHNYIFKSNKLVVLLPKEKQQIQHEKRIKNVSEMYKTKYVFYIDEFIWKYCTAESFKNYTNIKIDHFVDPYLKDYKEITAMVFISQWLNSTEESLLVIKGTGGIGKTTLVKKIAEYIHNKLSFKQVIFIDAIDIKSEIAKQSALNDYNIDIYDLYKINDRNNNQSEENRTLDKSLFQVNLDNGNIVIIIDGLDEIITKLDNSFDLYKFLKSTKYYLNHFASGKVILTCRNYFWNIDENNIPHTTIEIAPFDSSLARQYFSNFFKDEVQIKKGLYLADSFTKNSDKKEYIPFVLDIVKYVLQSERENLEELESVFDSSMLNININNDYLIYKICDRETRKLDQKLNVDSQIKVFIELAKSFNSAIKESDLNKVLDKALSGQYEKRSINSLKAHPILTINEKVLTFRYSLFEEHFNNIYLLQYINNNIPFENNIVDILNNNITFNSTFTRDLSNRLGSLTDEVMLRIIEIKENIINQKNELFTKQNDKYRAISALFVLTLKMMQKKMTMTKENATILLKEMFEIENELRNVMIMGINRINSDKIIFDFSNMKIVDGIISDYDYFWECTFNEQTKFDNTIIENVPIKKNFNTTAKHSNIQHNCKIDNTVYHALKNSEQKEEKSKRKIAKDIREILKIFYKNGSMMPQKENVIYAQFRGDTKYYLKILSELELLMHHESEKKTLGSQYEINKIYVQECIKYCFENMMSVKINNTIKYIFEDIH